MPYYESFVPFLYANLPLQENCVEFEASVVAQCDALIDAVKLRKQQLLEHIQQERARKQRTFKEQVTQCTAKVHKTTSLLQFSIEVLKEADPGAFLQVITPLPCLNLTLRFNWK